MIVFIFITMMQKQSNCFINFNTKSMGNPAAMPERNRLKEGLLA